MNLSEIVVTFGIAFIDHLGLDGKYNEVNPNVEVEYNRFVSGAYYNSFSEPSVYAGYTVWQGWADLDLGVVTGYNDSVMPYVKFEKSLNENVSIIAAPVWGGGSDQSFGLMVGLNVTMSLTRGRIT